jgi:hypothetical protein
MSAKRVVGGKGDSVKRYLLDMGRWTKGDALTQRLLIRSARHWTFTLLVMVDILSWLRCMGYLASFRMCFSVA